jgi:peptide/nickel transport system substrate-binding protein
VTKPHLVLLLVLVAVLVGCAAPAAQPTTSAPEAMRLPTVLSMVINTEVSNLAMKAVGPTSPARTTRLFNAGLTIVDAQTNVLPYLATELPQLNTSSWQVLPDGGMETTWRLRPGLTWHDSQPLTAEDFAFAFQVYRAPTLSGVFTSRPQTLIEQVLAPDPQTVRIVWNAPFLHTGEGLEPLPRALLAESYAALEQDPVGQRDAFMAQRFWTSDYVGAGPFRLTSWEPASHIEAAAFAGHALGRPKVDRLVLRFINNANTALASIMGGQTHVLMNNVIGFEHAMVLQREAGFNDAEARGKLLFLSTATTTAVTQHRPEYQQTPALHDPRVRKAIAHATDKEGIVEALFESQVPVPHTFVSREAPYYAEVERVITKYAYDPRRTEQIMADTGFVKDRDGFFSSPNGERLQPALWNSAGAEREQLHAIMLNSWQRAGIAAQPMIMSAALERDQQARATFPGVLVHSIGLGEASSASSLASEEIATPANRWNGSNRGGWTNPEYELLWERFNTTLNRPEQVQAFVQMMKLQSEQLPNYPLSNFLTVTAHVSALKGPQGDSPNWNIHTWELVP